MADQQKLRREEKVMNTKKKKNKYSLSQNGCLSDRWHHDDPDLGDLYLLDLFSMGRQPIPPDGFTLDWYINLLDRSSLLTSLWSFTVYLCGGVKPLSVVLVLPAIFVVFYYFPEARQGDEYPDLIAVRCATCGVIGWFTLIVCRQWNLTDRHAVDSGLAIYYHRVAIYVYRAIANSFGSD